MQNDMLVKPVIIPSPSPGRRKSTDIFVIECTPTRLEGTVQILTVERNNDHTRIIHETHKLGIIFMAGVVAVNQVQCRSNVCRNFIVVVQIFNPGERERTWYRTFRLYPT
jgi:hypothetical protein